MPFYRRRRRFRKKVLRKGNIFSRRSAKSQAKQIYALNKRVTSIYKRTAPEVYTQIRYGTNFDIDANSQNRFQFYTSSSTGQSYYIVPYVQRPAQGSSDGPTNGYSNQSNNFQRLRDIKFYGRVSFSTAIETPLWVRLVIVQSITTRNENITISDIFTPGPTGADYYISTLGPLQPGLARTCKVLRDKKYRLDSQHPAYNIRFNIKKLANVYYDSVNSASPSTPSELVPKGAIYMFLSAYSPTSTPETFPKANIQPIYKLVYTDA